MAYEAEAIIANELMKVAMGGLLYRGSKPVMWSVVERTALAEAEVEYHEHASPAIWVKFPVVKAPSPQPSPGELALASSQLKVTASASGRGVGEGVGRARNTVPSPLAGEGQDEGEETPPSIVIWTTTPWTIPGNRAIAFSNKIEYGVYEVY